MGKVIAERKKEEIESFEKQEMDDEKKIRHDACPVCGSPTTSFPYVAFLPSPYGWLECPMCGTVFCPKSIRAQKVNKIADIVGGPASNIILPV